MTAEELVMKESASTSHNEVDDDLIKGSVVVGCRDFAAIFGGV